MPLRIRTRPARRLARPRAPACVFCLRQRHGSTRFFLRASSTATATATATATVTTAATIAASVPTRPTPVPTPSFSSSSSRTASAQQARSDLLAALRALEHQAGGLGNAARLQLAIRGLQQPPGHETVRVAVLALGNDGHSAAGSTATARALLRLLLADPLEDKAAPWEQRLDDDGDHDNDNNDVRQPLVVRVRGDTTAIRPDATSSSRMTVTTTASAPGAGAGGIPELDVASAALRGHRLEFLLMATPAAALAVPPTTPTTPTPPPWDETVLVPTVAMPVEDRAGGLRFTSVATPVHQTLLVADGLLGVAAMGALPLGVHTRADGADTIRAVVAGVPTATATTTNETLPFALVDPAVADEALAQIRASIANARAYDALWRQSGLTPLAAWLREGARDRADGATKPPVRQLVASVLQHTRTAARAAAAEAHASEEAAAATVRAAATGAEPLAPLYEALADWAEAAHAELQTQLDTAALARGPWRALGWWKLFWRVDDVTQLAGALVAQRFLPQAEREAIYLAGRLGPVAPAAGFAAPVVAGAEGDVGPTTKRTTTPWPEHIAFTRRYLLDQTVPALQALAQRLVLQTAGASGLATALGALTYGSAVSSAAVLGTVTATASAGAGGGGLYEGGAVAALGIVWSLRRLQTRWEAARAFWEAGVREEGRKAVRAVEASVAAALDAAAAAESSSDGHASGADAALQTLQETQALVDRAEEALARLP